MDRYIYFFGTIGGLIFVFLVLNQSGGKAASGVLGSIGTAGSTVIKTLQGR